MTPSFVSSNCAGSLNFEGCIFSNYLEVATAIVVSMGLIENSRKSIVLRKYCVLKEYRIPLKPVLAIMGRELIC